MLELLLTCGRVTLAVRVSQGSSSLTVKLAEHCWFVVARARAVAHEQAQRYRCCCPQGADAAIAAGHRAEPPRRAAALKQPISSRQMLKRAYYHVYGICSIYPDSANSSLI
eukprot:3651361-Pleurochrysis_carterae.AAC.3